VYPPPAREETGPIISGGTCRGDTAAKGYRSYYNHHAPRQWLVRRPARLKVRTFSSLKQAPAAAAKVQRNCAQPLDIVECPASTVGAPASNEVPSTNGPAPPSLAAADGQYESGLMADAQTEPAAGEKASGESMHKAPAASTSPACELTDFSNHLGIIEAADDGDASVTVVDSDAFSHVADDDDMYGWEAELDRKATNGPPAATGSLCYCHKFQYRRADGGRRNLIHRVFSRGPRSGADPPRPPA